MPGVTREQGGFEEYDRGHIAVHEAGHWFGLNRTFVGSWDSATGDFVDDIPTQRSEIYGCPAGSDSCPDQPGMNPIRNFMGYTSDNCTSEFTAGQKRRMFETFFGFRRALVMGNCVSELLARNFYHWEFVTIGNVGPWKELVLLGMVMSAMEPTTDEALGVIELVLSSRNVCAFA
ncbi:Putative peptidase M43, pregnancy-associated plasma-A [Septoria linicola]|uniref:Peptidase M43, pregnancy-associated plasma-A n=1 Tax=Septoria linicola TaxID=215465 RepID=A0A9Q9AP52_9PEZI|nr:putative peptidase M43, pregnancy-associated plasma-A [Septoria linicola]USW51834.1 Putative peptidase M43, pregnancy-associated plasma-A [Septoria linicola]